MKLIVNTLDRKTFNITFDEERTVWDLKKHLSALLNAKWQPEEIELIYSGYNLNDNTTIKNYCIDERKFLVLLYKTMKPKKKPESILKQTVPNSSSKVTGKPNNEDLGKVKTSLGKTHIKKDEKVLKQESKQQKEVKKLKQPKQDEKRMQQPHYTRELKRVEDLTRPKRRSQSNNLSERVQSAALQKNRKEINTRQHKTNRSLRTPNPLPTARKIQTRTTTRIGDKMSSAQTTQKSKKTIGSEIKRIIKLAAKVEALNAIPPSIPQKIGRLEFKEPELSTMLKIHKSEHSSKHKIHKSEHSSKHKINKSEHSSKLKMNKSEHSSKLKIKKSEHSSKLKINQSEHSSKHKINKKTPPHGSRYEVKMKPSNRFSDLKDQQSYNDFPKDFPVVLKSLQNNSRFLEMCSEFIRTPELLCAVLAKIGETNSDLLRTILDNKDAFILPKRRTSISPAKAQSNGNVKSGSNLPSKSNSKSDTVFLNQKEYTAVQRMTTLGFSCTEVLEAYLKHGKDELRTRQHLKNIIESKTKN